MLMYFRESNLMEPPKDVELKEESNHINVFLDTEDGNQGDVL